MLSYCGPNIRGQTLEALRLALTTRVAGAEDRVVLRQAPVLGFPFRAGGLAAARADRGGLTESMRPVRVDSKRSVSVASGRGGSTACRRRAVLDAGPRTSSPGRAVVRDQVRRGRVPSRRTP